jgi:hypothetical protein
MNTATLKRALEIHGHRRLCGHEAGHCAAALTLGLQVASAAAPFHTLEDLEDGDPESPAGRVLILAPAGEREMALVTLMGRLEENKPDWPPTWPLTLAPEPGDEADLIEHVKALGLDEPGYTNSWPRPMTSGAHPNTGGCTPRSPTRSRSTASSTLADSH